jgi:hypothetical protein
MTSDDLLAIKKYLLKDNHYLFGYYNPLEQYKLQDVIFSVVCDIPMKLPIMELWELTEVYIVLYLLQLYQAKQYKYYPQSIRNSFSLKGIIEDVEKQFQKQSPILPRVNVIEHKAEAYRELMRRYNKVIRSGPKHSLNQITASFIIEREILKYVLSSETYTYLNYYELVTWLMCQMRELAIKNNNIATLS